MGAAWKSRHRRWPNAVSKLQAVALLRRNLATYGNTSIGPRLQKNLNLLSMAGKPAPPLKITEYLGPKPVALSQLSG